MGQTSSPDLAEDLRVGFSQPLEQNSYVMGSSRESRGPVVVRGPEVGMMKVMDGPQIGWSWGYPGDIIRVHLDLWNPCAMCTHIMHFGAPGMEPIY